MILANRKPEGEELDEMVKVWQGVFQAVIPEEKIGAAWKRAISTHKSSFPVNAFDVLKSFHEIEAEEAQINADRTERERVENPVKFCDYKKHHINEHGDVLELIGGLGGCDVVLPCPFCRKDAYKIRYAEEKKKYVENNGTEPERLVINESNVFEMFGKLAKKSE